MLRFVLFDTTLFSGADNVELSRKDLCWLLEALTQRNQHYLRQRPSTPPLYKSGVVYERPKQQNGECYEAGVLRKALGSKIVNREVQKVLDTVSEVFSGEHFCDIGRIMELGAIDCDGLACWRAAELRQSGIMARPYMTHRQGMDGGTIYHALVLWPPIPTIPYMTSEDPSLILGMGGEVKKAERQEEIRKNQERCDLLRGGIPTGGKIDFTPEMMKELDALLKRAA